MQSRRQKRILIHQCRWAFEAKQIWGSVLLSPFISWENRVSYFIF